MPLFDDILSQPAILISVGIALLLIVAAIVLAVLPRIKASRARAHRRKLAAKAEQEAIEAAERAAAQESKGGRRRRAAAQSNAANSDDNAAHAAASTPAASAGGKAPVAPGPTVAAGPSAAAPTAPAAAAKAPAAPLVSSGGTTTTTESKEDEVSPEMQDLLSSVFSDEENSERQAILLKGVEPVSIDELLTLSKAVAAQLHGEQPTNIVRVKENELS